MNEIRDLDSIRLLDIIILIAGMLAFAVVISAIFLYLLTGSTVFIIGGTGIPTLLVYYIFYVRHVKRDISSKVAVDRENIRKLLYEERK